MSRRSLTSTTTHCLWEIVFVVLSELLFARLERVEIVQERKEDVQSHSSHSSRVAWSFTGDSTISACAGARESVVVAEVNLASAAVQAWIWNAWRKVALGSIVTVRAITGVGLYGKTRIEWRDACSAVFARVAHARVGYLGRGRSNELTILTIDAQRTNARELRVRWLQALTAMLAQTVYARAVLIVVLAVLAAEANGAVAYVSAVVDTQTGTAIQATSSKARIGVIGSGTANQSQ